MSDPFLGEVRMFAGNFAPVGWVMCNGQALNIAENDALFTLLGLTYGGDGVNTFNVPDLQGRTPICAGTGDRLTPRVLGAILGSETVTLTPATMPTHLHPVHACSIAGTLSDPTNAVWAAASTAELQYSSLTPNVTMSATATSNAGGGAGHENMAPFLAVSFIIATAGIYPSQG
jgi:microcystin-dependent protein